MTTSIPAVCPYCGVGSNLELSLDASMKRGYLFAPIHFSDPNFNSLMSAVPIDPQARMPALKIIPVKVEKELIIRY